uniref:Uncharacterized protein n=1 Tax=Vitis vinifera TaxID=29760 RepID=A5C5Q4_VITVI|nr:hypothetical protein VITISV_009623 [Vitis vinifera]
MAKFWVAIESKTFEVSIEEVKGKLKGIIVERSRGFSSWIRFGVSSLRKLLEGFEECCREEKKGRLVKVWEEEGRKFRLERRVNGAGRYVLCSVVDVEAKRFCLVFPEGKDVIGGWAILVEKLRALGIVTKKEDKDKLLHLERWSEEAGCLEVGSQTKEVWVRVVGLPLYCWSEELFSRMGDCCGGFVEVDEETKNLSQLQWARILVKNGGNFFPGTLNLVVKSFCYAVRLWWEVQPRVLAMEPMKNLRQNEGERVREEEDEGSRAGSSGVVRKKKGKEKSDGDRMEASADGSAGYGKEDGWAGLSGKDSLDRHDNCKPGCEVAQPNKSLGLEREDPADWAVKQKDINGPRASSDGPPSFQRDGLGRLDNRPKVLEERCGHEVVLKETEEGLSVNPLSVCPTEERLGEKSASGSLPLKEGREERGVEEVGNYSVSCRFKNCEDGFCWVFSGVYGPSVKVEREEFLSELGAIRGLWNELWCVAGDFNMIRFPYERSRGGRLSPTMRRFSEVIEELELRDLPLQGRMFTWSGGLNNLLKSRIDRFLISEDWEAHFQGCIQVVLARPLSDHSLIILDGGRMRRRPTPFKLENMWLKEEDLKRF